MSLMFMINIFPLQNIPEILDIYENEFNKLSERYFVEFPWPIADLVAPLVQKGMGQSTSRNTY